jgi:hypothetical protein
MARKGVPSSIWRYSVAAAIGASKMQQKIVGLFRKDLEGLNVPVG